MPSRDAPSTALAKIKHALRLWNCTGYVAWDDQPHNNRWMEENLDLTRYTRREIARLMDEFVGRGGKVTEQDSPQDQPSEYPYWYYILVPIDGREVFIKFLIEDADDDPYLLIVSIHWPLSS